MGQPITTQVSFQWLEDDEDLELNSVVGSLGVNDDLISPSTDYTYRLRILLDNTGDKDETDGYVLRYSINAGVDYTTVTTTSSYVRMLASANTSWTVTDGDATAQRIGVGTFDEGYFDDNGAIAEFTLGQNVESENEFCFQFRSADITNETILLQVWFDGVIVLDAYTQTPSTTFVTGGQPTLVRTFGVPTGPGARIRPGGWN